MSELASEVARHEAYFNALDALPNYKNAEKEEVRKCNVRLQQQLNMNESSSEQFSRNGEESGGDHVSIHGGQIDGDGKEPGATGKHSHVSEDGKSQSAVKGHRNTGNLGKGVHVDKELQPLAKHKSLVPHREGSVRFRGFGAPRGSSNQHLVADTYLTGIEEEGIAEDVELVDSLAHKPQETGNLGDEDGSGHDSVPASSGMFSRQNVSEHSVDALPIEGENNHVQDSGSDAKDAGASIHKLGLRRTSSGISRKQIESLQSSPAARTGDSSADPGDISMLPSGSSGLEARNRWRRVKHTLAFAHHMSHNVRSGSGDFMEHAGDERLTQDYNARSDDGRAGAAAFEGAKIRGKFRAKGRMGMEGMLVRQDKGIITLVQDFYVACLKMPIAHFLVGVFLAPIALGLLFTPIYLLDKRGLSFNGATLADAVVIVGRVAAAKKRVSTLVNVFLYALSLSTTFGGSPVAALSPFCLCVANVHTLMGQFLFVFLSGAVFARMSQPSQPIRCSKKAIIRPDDFTSTPSDVPKEKSKVFAVRLVLTGPPPCELVDAKICLTFRIFIKLPSGSMFCSTQDLDLVRPEVSYLRYGIMVRHVIDHKSPVYGHTMESLLDGDASFSLTIMGLERASMQPIFHLEDYFVCDGDVAWDADYVDFIHINNSGHRVLDHSKIDLIKVTAKTRMTQDKKASEGQKELKTAASDNQSPMQGWRAHGLGRDKAWHSKSASFTRADW